MPNDILKIHTMKHFLNQAYDKLGIYYTP